MCHGFFDTQCICWCSTLAEEACEQLLSSESTWHVEYLIYIGLSHSCSLSTWRGGERDQRQMTQNRWCQINTKLCINFITWACFLQGPTDAGIFWRWFFLVVKMLYICRVRSIISCTKHNFCTCTSKYLTQVQHFSFNVGFFGRFFLFVFCLQTFLINKLGINQKLDWRAVSWPSQACSLIISWQMMRA